MTTGTIKWFDATMGFGFITPDDGSADVFIHQSKVKDFKNVKLEAGSVVDYFMGAKDGKNFAFDLTVLKTEKAVGHIRHPNPQPRAKVQTLDALEQFEQDWGLRRA